MLVFSRDGSYIDLAQKHPVIKLYPTDYSFNIEVEINELS